MPIPVPPRELESEFLNWVNSQSTLHAIAFDGTLSQMQALIATSPLGWAQVVAFELIEGGANGYSRTSVKPVTLPTPTYDATDMRTEVARATYTATIPANQTWDYYGTAVGVNSRPWANRLISTVTPAADTIAFPANSATFATGDRVILTADTGAVLPGGVGAGQIYTLQSVTTNSGTVTAKLRAIGAGADLDITSAGSGSLRVRSVDGFAIATVFEGTGSIGSPTLSRQSASLSVQFGVLSAAQAADPSKTWPVP